VSQINRNEAGWQLVDPDDLIPEIDILEDLSARTAVDPYLDYVPGPRTPEYYPTPPVTPGRPLAINYYQNITYF
jgi:hypothetical protein